MNLVQVVRLHRHKTSVFPQESIRTLPEGDWMLRNGTSSTPLSCRGGAGDSGDAVYDLRDDVDLLEKRISQMGAPSKTPFRFMQSSQSHSE